MSKTYWSCVAAGAMLVGCIASPARSATEIYWAIHALPGSVFAHTSDEFVLQGNGVRQGSSMVSSMPNASTGIGIEQGKWSAEVTAGVGMILNSSYSSFMLQGTLWGSYEAATSVTVGPHIGLIYLLGPDWSGAADVELADTTGWMAGVHLTMGDKISYLFQVDLISAEVDAQPGTGWSAEGGSLDLTGIAVQFGLKGKF